MKKILIFSIISILLVFSFAFIFAQETTTTTTSESTTTTVSSTTTSTTTSTTEPTTTTNPTTTTSTTTTTIPKPIKPILKGINPNDLKQSLTIEEVRGWRLGVLSQLPTTTSPAKNSTVVYIKAGVVEEVGSDYLKVKIFGYNFKVKIDSSNSVRVLKQNWGKIDLDDISVGDIVNVYGYLDNSDNTLVYALTIRDLSIITAHISLKGVITSIDSANKTFELKTNNNQQVKVIVNNETKIVKYDENEKKYVEGSFSDLKVNDPVIVRGIYNRTQNTLTAENIIIGRDERPYFKSFIPSQIQEQERERLKNQSEEIRNQIKNQIQQLQEYINQIMKNLKERKGQ
ncbi:MAG: DUF5666 domain-containing protein [Minisyncoccia bacterium]